MTALQNTPNTPPTEPEGFASKVGHAIAGTFTGGAKGMLIGAAAATAVVLAATAAGVLVAAPVALLTGQASALVGSIGASLSAMPAAIGAEVAAFGANIANYGVVGTISTMAKAYLGSGIDGFASITYTAPAILGGAAGAVAGAAYGALKTIVGDDDGKGGTSIPLRDNMAERIRQTRAPNPPPQPATTPSMPRPTA